MCFFVVMWYNNDVLNKYSKNNFKEDSHEEVVYGQ